MRRIFNGCEPSFIAILSVNEARASVERVKAALKGEGALLRPCRACSLMRASSSEIRGKGGDEDPMNPGGDPVGLLDRAELLRGVTGFLSLASTTGLAD